MLPVHKTRFTELGYWHIPSSPGEGPSFWQCVDLTGDKPAQVGYQYATEKELLANLEAYATEYGCENANPKPRQDENFARLLRVAKEIASCPTVDLGDSELRIRLYYAIQEAERNPDDYADTAPHNEPPADRSRDDAGAADPRNDRED